MILLDTQVLVWLSVDESRPGRQAMQVIDLAREVDDLAVSAISFWEVAMLHDKGRLTFLTDIGAWRADLLRQGLVELPVDGATAIRAGLLEAMHGDPADRLIVATALAGHQLVTADQRILDWPGNLSRLDARG